MTVTDFKMFQLSILGQIESNHFKVCSNLRLASFQRVWLRFARSGLERFEMCQVRLVLTRNSLMKLDTGREFLRHTATFAVYIAGHQDLIINNLES